jgi:hypothetical protein
MICFPRKVMRTVIGNITAYYSNGVSKIDLQDIPDGTELLRPLTDHNLAMACQEILYISAPCK